MNGPRRQGAAGFRQWLSVPSHWLRRALAWIGRVRPRLSVRRLTRILARLGFMAPALVLIALLIAFPVLQTVYLSFVTPGRGWCFDFSWGFDWDPVRLGDLEWDPARFGFDWKDCLSLGQHQAAATSTDTINLERLPRPPPYGTLMHNLLWISIHLPLSLLAGLALALILREVRGASMVKSAIFLGMVTPLIVGGVILRFLYEGGVGMVPAFFGFLGVESLRINWMAHPHTLLFGLIFGSVWLWTGFSLILYSAGLTTIPQEYFEAAKIDGASTLRTFLRVTLPLLRPITITVITMTILWELKIFDIVIAATNPSGGVGGAADVFATQMYRYAFVQGDWSRGAAVATILTAMTLMATIWMFRYMVRK